jgi:hypothetical protein
VSEIFDPNEMKKRGERLKREGRMPPLSEILGIVQSVTATPAPLPRKKGKRSR